MVNMICLVVLALAVFTAPTPATAADTCGARVNKAAWDTAPPGFVWKSEIFGDVSPGAVVGGTAPNGDALYICRTFVAHQLIPGKVDKTLGNCGVAYGGKEHMIPVYQVLVYQDHIAETSWVDAEDGFTPANAVVGGYKCDCELPKGNLDYVGRSNSILCPNSTCLSWSTVLPGKVISCEGGFQWSYFGMAFKTKTYQVAVWNMITTVAPVTTEELVPVTTEEIIPVTTEEIIPVTEEEFVPETTLEPVEVTTEEIINGHTEYVPVSTEEIINGHTEIVPITTDEFVPVTTEENVHVFTEESITITTEEIINGHTEYVPVSTEEDINGFTVIVDVTTEELVPESTVTSIDVTTEEMINGHEEEVVVSTEETMEVTEDVTTATTELDVITTTTS